MATTWSFSQPVPEVRTVSLDPSSIPRIGTQEETFLVPDLLVTDHVVVIKPTNEDGISVLGARVSAVDELAITFQNRRFPPIAFDPALQDFLVLVTRV